MIGVVSGVKVTLKFKIMKLKWIIWAVIAIALVCHWGFLGVVVSGIAFAFMLENQPEEERR